MKRLFLVLLLFGCAVAHAEITTASDPIAVAFMNQTVATYSAMRTYQGRGRSSQTLKFYPADADAAVVVVDFSTRFERPRKFRFSWTTTENVGDGPEVTEDAVWSDGASVWSWSSNHAIPETEEDFGMALAGATGVSQGMAHDVFRLLSDEIKGFRYDQLKQLEIVGTEDVAGVECNIAHGFQYETEVKLWIGKQDHLIRKGIKTQVDTNTNTFERTDTIVDKNIPNTDFVLQNRSNK